MSKERIIPPPQTLVDASAAVSRLLHDPGINKAPLSKLGVELDMLARNHLQGQPMPTPTEEITVVPVEAALRLLKDRLVPNINPSERRYLRRQLRRERATVLFEAEQPPQIPKQVRRKPEHDSHTSLRAIKQVFMEHLHLVHYPNVIIQGQSCLAI